MFYVAADMEAGSRFAMLADYLERAVYAVDGDILVDDDPLEARHMAVLPVSQETTIEATTTVRVMLLGGEAIDGDRFIWWNFVASSREAIQQAKQQWRAQEFGKVPDETEWIPLS